MTVWECRLEVWARGRHVLAMLTRRTPCAPTETFYRCVCGWGTHLLTSPEHDPIAELEALLHLHGAEEEATAA